MRLDLMKHWDLMKRWGLIIYYNGVGSNDVTGNLQIYVI
jgi:hypothetical protein